MGYRIEWKPSPNFTPGNQSQAYYGRPRTIEFGAGHWWGSPTAGYSHAGVVNTFLNPARQASAHAVVSEGLVTEMVRPHDISWATNNANPFTVSIELKPNMTPGDKETCAEYIADKGWHNLPWRPHNTWWNTACNPLPWGEIMTRAKQIHAAKHAPAPAPTPEWIRNLVDIQDVKLQVLVASTTVINLNTGQPVGSPIPQKTWVDFAKKTVVGGKTYLISNYSVTNAMPNGILEAHVGLPTPTPPVEDKPEWLKNWEDIADVTMYARADSDVVNLITGATVGTVKRGTPVDVASATTWHGQQYFITKYSTDKKLPHGMRVLDLDMKPVDPVPTPIPPAVPNEELIKEIKGLWQKILELMGRLK